jgi:hypothetical protein
MAGYDVDESALRPIGALLAEQTRPGRNGVTSRWMNSRNEPLHVRAGKGNNVVAIVS